MIFIKTESSHHSRVEEPAHGPHPDSRFLHLGSCSWVVVGSFWVHRRKEVRPAVAGGQAAPVPMRRQPRAAWPPGHPSCPDSGSIYGTAVSCQVLWAPGHRADCTGGLPVLLAFTVWWGSRRQARISIKTGHCTAPWEHLVWGAPERAWVHVPGVFLESSGPVFSGHWMDEG